MNEEDLKVLAAIAAAAASVVVSVITFISTRANQRNIERLRAELVEKQSDADARRAYRYDALKRLYSQYEPIRFHFVEACESAIESTRQLATLASPSHAATEGALPRGNYLRLSRVYRVLLPIALFRTMQSRLTLVDLGASRSAHLQYLLAKHAVVLITADSAVAGYFGLQYTPYVQNWRELRAECPQRYRRQGFAPGRLDNAAAAMLKAAADGAQVPVSFGEFETLTRGVAADEYNSAIGAALDLLEDFTPQTRPVLWRILLIQLVVYRLFVFAARIGIEDAEPLEDELRKVEAELRGIAGCGSLAQGLAEYVRSQVLTQVGASSRRP